MSGFWDLASNWGCVAETLVAPGQLLGLVKGTEASRAVENIVRGGGQVRNPGSTIVSAAAAEGYMHMLQCRSAADTCLGGGIARAKQVVAGAAQAGLKSWTPA